MQSCPAETWLNSKRLFSTANLSVLRELHLHPMMLLDEGSLLLPKLLGVGEWTKNKGKETLVCPSVINKPATHFIHISAMA